MELGPSTIRADADVRQTAQRLRARRISDIIVTNPDGELAGVLHANDGYGQPRRADSEVAEGPKSAAPPDVRKPATMSEAQLRAHPVLSWTVWIALAQVFSRGVLGLR
jgi:Mg/Co/Ni transporter MgtE